MLMWKEVRMFLGSNRTRCRMVEEIGAAQNTAALPLLLRWVACENRDLQTAVLAALNSVDPNWRQTRETRRTVRNLVRVLVEAPPDELPEDRALAFIGPDASWVATSLSECLPRSHYVVDRPEIWESGDPDGHSYHVVAEEGHFEYGDKDAATAERIVKSAGCKRDEVLQHLEADKSSLAKVLQRLRRP